MAVVGILLHHERDQAAELARDAAAWLARARPRGPAARCATPASPGSTELGVADDELRPRARPGRQPRRRRHHAAHRRPRGGRRRARARRQRRPARLPHRGRAAGAAHGAQALPRRVVRGRGAHAARRSRVEPAPTGPGAVPRPALNEAVLEKTPMGHTVRLGVSASTASSFTTYAADGLIVATPDRVDRLRLLGPRPDRRAHPPAPAAHAGLAAHALRPLAGARPRRAACASRCVGDRPATLSVDGRNLGTLHRGRRRRRAPRPRQSARLVTFGPRNFHRILKAKFGLADR